MDSSTLQDRLKSIIEPYVQDKEAFKSMTGQTDLLSDLKINSAHLVDIILDAEDAFDIEIDDESAEKMLTVQDAVDVINAKLNP